MKICVALPSARKPSSRSAIDIKEILRPSGPPRCANISTAAGSRACQCLVSERESPSPTCQLKQKGRKKNKNQSQSEPPKSRPSALVGAFFTTDSRKWMATAAGDTCALLLKPPFKSAECFNVALKGMFLLN